jgi:hypothetical protein
MTKPNSQPLTLAELQEAQPRTILRNGIKPFNGRAVKFVAVRGLIEDWAIYYGHICATDTHVARFGTKLIFEKDIKAFVECSQDAFEMYRY